MTDIQRQKLLDAGVCIEDALHRLMNNETLLFRLLSRFSQDNSFDALQQALTDGRTEDAFTAAHTLKGVAGNLSLQPLFARCSELVEDLRNGDLTGARQKFPALETQYRTTLSALEAFSAL